MIKIAPSILSAVFANLQRDIEKIATADYVHVDVMDGLFAVSYTQNRATQPPLPS